MVEPANPVVEPAETPSAAAPAVTPLFSVVKGQPSPEELAALTAVVLSLGASAPARETRPSVRHWVRRQQLRLAPTPGPGAWKRSRG
ncbi:acyl-CoA carboxylase subunit epsilon [Pseudarthrobacter sp. NamE2]|uniref:acyl-CoA carboxylase subunit epsilon n=1 Tax=Pseudarthrobacter sp. NamE2 TaxID=2576838 RepID=UPI0010FE4EBC|nr:acyl-CoA carboxylase subunit epsilon [Pseudarthrobacter sp. NamE2]TLM84832.1 acyl-CoA carboxylase subunit epsilon [Pseudarthrobacter sp. NamE2]